MFSLKLLKVLLIAIVFSLVYAQSELVLEQSLEHPQGLACQLNTLNIVVSNNSDSTVEYTLAEFLPKGIILSDNNLETITWFDKIGPQEKKSYSLNFSLSSQAAASLEFIAQLEANGKSISKTTSLEKLNLSAGLSRLGDSALYVGDTVNYQLSITNPLAQEISVNLGTAAVRLNVTNMPKNVNIAANSTATVDIQAEVTSAGRTALQILPYVCEAFASEQAASNAISIREEASAAPSLPAMQETTTISMNLAAYQLKDIVALVVVQKLPEGVGYLANSSILNGRSIPDPKQYENELIYELADFNIGQLAFTVVHTGEYIVSKEDITVIALTPEPVLIVGDENVLEHIQNASLAKNNTVIRERVGAVILKPANNSVIYSGNQTSVSADMPLNAEYSLLINGQAVAADKLGEKTTDSLLNRQTLDFYGITLKEGPNQLILTVNEAGQSVSDEITVFVAGRPAEVKVIPLSPLLADSNTPLKFAVTATDAWGKIPASKYLSFEIDGADAGLADADPQRVGYQVKLTDGYGELLLSPVSEAKEITISVLTDKKISEHKFDIKPNLRPWIVDGYGSVGAAYDLAKGAASVGAQASFFARGQIFENYLLTVSANYPGKPIGLFGVNPYENAYEAFPVTGSSGNYSQDAYSQDGVYARIEKDQSYLQYGDFNTQFEGNLLQLNRPFTGLSGKYKNDSIKATAYLSNEAVSDMVRDQFIKANGMHVYNLGRQDEILPDSLNLKVVKASCESPNKRVNDNDPLVRELYAVNDYSLDERSGILRLNFYLPPFDAKGQCYYLLANYQLKNNNAQKALQYGGQVSYNLGDVSFRAGAFQENAADNKYSRVVAAGAAYNADNVRADVELAYGQDQDSAGLAASVQVAYRQESLLTEAKYRYYSDSYRSNLVTNSEQAGHELSASLNYAISPELQLATDASVTTYSKDNSSRLSSNFKVVYTNNNDYYIGSSLIGRHAGANFGIGYSLNRVNASELRALIGLNIRDLFGINGTQFGISHAQGLNLATKSTTDFTVSYQVLDNLSVRFTDKLVWGNANTLLLGFDAGFSNNEILSTLCMTQFCEFNDPRVNLGTTVLTAEYSFEGGLNSKAGRLRLGLNTSYPVTDEISLEAGLSQDLDLKTNKANTTVSVGAAYNTQDLKANVNYDISFGVSTKHYLFVGSTFALDKNLFGSINAEYNSSAQGQGSKFSFAAAYRGSRLSVLANHTARFGLYAPKSNTDIFGDTRLNYVLAEGWSLRAGYIYAFNDSLGFRDMYSLGATAYLWQGGSVSAFGRYFNDWKNSNSSLGATLELSQDIACGAQAVAGYNFFDGTSTNYGSVFGQPGLFVRLDVAFDEKWHCGTGTIGDFVFLDKNKNGIQDENEYGVAGVKLELYNLQNELLQSVYSNAEGKYEFDYVAAGKYIIKLDVPYGYAISPQHMGEDSRLDSDIDAISASQELELAWGQNLLSFDIGLSK